MKINKENSMLVDIKYTKPDKRNGIPDYLYIIWKDLNTLEKHLQIVEEPRMEIYFEKPEYRDHTYNKNYARLEELDKKVVKYKDIIYAIANDMGDVGQRRLNDCFTSRNYNGLKEFYMYPYVYGADYDIRVWYRHKWLEEFDNEHTKVISKGFMDIEVDTLESVGMPNAVNNPIDLVTLIDTTTKTSYTFALIGVECVNKDMCGMNPKERKKETRRREMYAKRMENQEYYSTHVEELQEEAHKMFDEMYPGFDYKFYFYKDERKMLVHLFQLVNKLKLDFIGFWNIAFDIPYIIERMQYLGLDPMEVICHPDFPSKECRFQKDENHFDPKSKSDFFHCTSYTNFYDQMITYAAIRKGGSELRSYKLTYIAEKEIGDKKLDYSEDGNIKTLSYHNYLKYVLYNIKDVLLQVGIENVTTDLETYYLGSYKNITPYEKQFKQTVKLRNVQYKSFLSQGLVPGENVNSLVYNMTNHDDDEDDVTFEGALVGNPKLNDNFGAKLFGKRTNSIFNYNIDFDMSSFYPSTIRAMNIDASNLIFKMILDPRQYDVRGGDIPFNGITDVQVVDTNKDSFVEDVSKEVMDNFQTGNILFTANKWLNLPSVTDVVNEIQRSLGVN